MSPIAFNLDLLLVGITVIAIGILGILVYLNNRKSLTNQAFLFFTVMTIAYGIINYLATQIKDPFNTLWLLRFTIFFAVWHAYSFFLLFFVFPEVKITFSFIYRYLFIPLVGIVSLLTLTPFVFSGIEDLSPVSQTAKAQVAIGMSVFIALAIYLIFGGVYFLINKIRKAADEEKKQLLFMLVGAILTFSLILLFNLILPAVFLIVRFAPLAPLFFLPFITFTSYAIIKHHLFNVKVIATEVLVFGLWLLLLVRALTANSIGDQIISVLVFLGSIVVGILLIRSVFKEVKIREEMSQLALDLEITNKELKQLDEAKSDFISIASHQLRTPLSIIKGYISMMREGTYGNIDAKIADPLHKVYVSNERLINLVSDLLDLSRMERGKMQYEFLPIRLAEVAEGIVLDFEKVAKDKGLTFEWDRGQVNDLIKGDAGKLRQIVLNLVDNAIKYTQAGGIRVALEAVPGNKVRFLVTDSGPGLTTEEEHALFQKFSRGQEESKTHTEGLGLGLYVAKLIASAHGGELNVTSHGKGKGSTFSLTLPIYSESAESFKKFTEEI